MCALGRWVSVDCLTIILHLNGAFVIVNVLCLLWVLFLVGLDLKMFIVFCIISCCQGVPSLVVGAQLSLPFLYVPPFSVCMGFSGVV